MKFQILSLKAYDIMACRQKNTICYPIFHLATLIWMCAHLDRGFKVLVLRSYPFKFSACSICFEASYDSSKEISNKILIKEICEAGSLGDGFKLNKTYLVVFFLCESRELSVIFPRQGIPFEIIDFNFDNYMQQHGNIPVEQCIRIVGVTCAIHISNSFSITQMR